MSPGGDFVNFFPAAPRSAKIKAKALAEKTIGKSAVASSKVDISTTTAQLELVAKGDGTGKGSGHIVGASSSDLVVDDNTSSPGDVLNGVGSASSHTSAGSSLFSAPGATLAQSSCTAGAWSNLTPLTNIDTSPVERTLTPSQSKSTQNMSSSSHSHDYPLDMKSDTDSKPAPPSSSNPHTRIMMRDPSRHVQGERCTYDPRLEGSKDKHAKPIYTQFGMVCKYILRGASSCYVRISG